MELELSDEEIRIVQAHRAQMLQVARKKAEQAECSHHWFYKGQWRGEDGYACLKCGVLEFR